MNNLIETTGVSEFQKVFGTCILSEYEYIYISLGSKYNTDVIEYNIPINQTIKKHTNAIWQMLPGFVRYKKTLAVCIDRFETNEIKQENNKILNNLLTDVNVNVNLNITMIVCDVDGTIQLFEHIIKMIIRQLFLYSIQKDHVVIVNYLRFITPNHTEYYLEQNLSPCIQSILSNTIYNNCFYEWFGYQPNLYNIIYRYNHRIIFHLLSNVICILQKKIQNSEFSTSNICILFGESIETHFLVIFLKNIYDITHINDMKSFYDYNQFTS